MSRFSNNIHQITAQSKNQSLVEQVKQKGLNSIGKRDIKLDIVMTFGREHIVKCIYIYIVKQFFFKVHILKLYCYSTFLSIHRELHIVNVSHFNDCVKNKSKQSNNNDNLPQGLSCANTTTKQQRATITFMVMRHGLKMFGNISRVYYILSKPLLYYQKIIHRDAIEVKMKDVLFSW